MKWVTILGATGSIGVNTLDVIARHPDRYSVLALTANTQVERLYQQCLTHMPRYAALVDPDAAQQLRDRLQHTAPDIEVLAGTDGLIQLATMPDCDYVMAAIVGAAGLRPSLAAARAGKRILLANKEALVMSGQLFMDEVTRHAAELLPIDSEHNAIFQSMPMPPGQDLKSMGIKRILLTGSGGPFRQVPLEGLADVTAEQACNHPNWSMGRKISVDSATMMNKGLEIIEACWLFNAGPDQIQVVVHPQSVIHSMVEYVDGSVVGQLGQPDMRTPIAHALAWPERMASGVESLDLFSIGRLDFEPPDTTRFPCLRLADEAVRAGGTACTILNAANEVAVQAFLDKRISFLSIPHLVEAVLSQQTRRDAISLDVIIEDDKLARELAEQIILESSTGNGSLAGI